MWGYGSMIELEINEANSLAKTPADFENIFVRGKSRRWLMPIATQSSSRPALKTQVRSSKLVSRVPKAALWLLVSANLFFIGLSIGLTVLALAVTTPAVHQVRVRLCGAGFAAQLFEREFADRKVTHEEGLFEEYVQDSKEVKRIGIRRMRNGGIRFIVANR
jgi:hypothetical protein